MVDQKTMYRDDGSYNFKQREDWGYGHGYNYMAGWLGTDEERAEKKRKKKLGTVDVTAPPLPLDPLVVDTAEKTAKYVHKSSDVEVFERVVREKNKGKPGWSFMEEDGEGHEYYKFCRHCCEREVDPRPLAQHARKVMEDRDKKQTNARNNTFVASSGEPQEKKELKEAVFKIGEVMEVVGVKSKPDYNGKLVKVIGYSADVDRYEVKFQGGRYDTVVVKLREDNLMYSSLAERDPEKDKEMPEGEIPNGIAVEIRGLQSESARWLNGQKAIVVQWDKDGERYEVRLKIDNSIKKVKPGNVRVELPEGWEEHFDEHLGKFYYLNVKSQKVTWKHPTITNQRSKFNKVTENYAEEFKDVEIDENRKHYDVDDEEEMEGGFNLLELVKKVEEQEEKREAAEEAGEDDVDSDDGMHRVSKKKRKREKVTAEVMEARVVMLIQETMVARETLNKDYSLLEGNFVAREMDPVLKQWDQYDLSAGDPPDKLLRATFEGTLALIQKVVSLLPQLKRSQLQLRETHKVLQKIPTLTKPAELLDAAKWVSSLLKTM